MQGTRDRIVVVGRTSTGRIYEFAREVEVGAGDLGDLDGSLVGAVDLHPRRSVSGIGWKAVERGRRPLA